MGEVEDFIGSNRIATHSNATVEKRCHKAVALATLTVIYGELRVDSQCPTILFLRGTDGHIAQTDIGCMVEQHVAVDAPKAPEVLVFKIRPVAVFVNLDGYLVLAAFEV